MENNPKGQRRQTIEGTFATLSISEGLGITEKEGAKNKISQDARYWRYRPAILLNDQGKTRLAARSVGILE